MRTEHVFCKDCGIKIATWGFGSNYQYQEEWECAAKFRHTVHDMYRSVHNPKAQSNVQNDEFQIPVKSEMNYCALYYDTKYCRKCAEKRHFKCGRPRCKGHLVKVRNGDGSDTLHTHGGF